MLLSHSYQITYKWKGSEMNLDSLIELTWMVVLLHPKPEEIWRGSDVYAKETSTFLAHKMALFDIC